MPTVIPPMIVSSLSTEPPKLQANMAKRNPTGMKIAKAIE
jgi:hypothetical protein